jgi:aminobenzoyl-glutamate utilization protein A
LGVQALSFGEIIDGYRYILASVKLDVEFRGRSAHAAISPHEGRNALLAACVAAQNLHAISRHGDGETRVNVGLLSGGESRNAIAALAKLHAEIRADTPAILQHVHERALDVLNGAAQIHGVEVSIERVGASSGASSDPELAKVVAKACEGIAEVRSVRGVCDFKGSDDVADMMTAVHKSGGKAVYFGVGTALGEVHHNPRFDFDERALLLGVNVFLQVLRGLGNLK